MKLRVSKIEAAETQLECAIRMFFARANPVPIGTLVGAASGILTTLAKHYGLQAFLHDSDWIKPEKKREWIQHLHKEQNYFKHADKDHDEDLEYDPDCFQYLLVEACHLYRWLASEKYLKHRQCSSAIIYEIWFSMAHPHLLKDP